MPARQSRSNSSRNGWGRPVGTTELSWPLRLVDIGFLGLIVLLPFIWGGRQALGNFAVVLMSGWTAFWWAIHQLRQDQPRWRFSGAEPLFLLAALLVAVQTLTLPESFKESLSPHMNQLLPAWGDNPETSAGLGRWGSLSFAPWQTWSDLITLVAVMLVFFIAIQRLETVQDVHRLLKFVAISGCVTATFGLIQYLLGNGLFYWFYEHPDTSTETSAKAGFTNSNHFADFLAMSMPAQLWWYVTASKAMNKLRDARNLNNPAPTGWRGFLQEWSAAIMLGITAIAIMLSQSRGGLLVSVAGMSLTCLLFWRQRLLDSRVALCLLAISVAGIAAMMLFGSRLDKELSSNVESIQAGRAQLLDRDDSRKKIWTTDMKVVRDFPAVGTGLGTHRYVYPSYHDFPADGTEFTHAENGYLQVAMETGITGLAIAGLLICLVGYWCIRGQSQATSLEIKAPLVVTIAILAINLMHSCTDFVWYVPGCMVIVVLAAAASSVLYRLASPPPRASVVLSTSRVGRVAWGMMLVAVIAGLGWGVQVKWPEVAAEPHFHEYKRLANAKNSDGDELSSTNFEIAAILRAAQANPHDPLLQQRAGRAHVRTFLLLHEKDHDLQMEDIRQAAISSKYADRQALNAWLDIPGVMGENRRHLNRAQAAFLRAMRLCPLESRPYIESAKLAWLSNAPVEMEKRLMQQALTARPYDGLSWMEYAHSLVNVGMTNEAVSSYQKAFIMDPRCRGSIIFDLSPHYPASFFLSMFDMDRHSLTELRKAYARTNDIRGYQSILKQLAKSELDAALRSSGEASASHIVTAHGCFAEMGDVELATSILQKAIKRHGNSYNLRYNLGNWLYDHGRYADALPHLEWCHRRRPDNQTLITRIETAVTTSDQPIQMAEKPDNGLRIH